LQRCLCANMFINLYEACLEEKSVCHCFILICTRPAMQRRLCVIALSNLQGACIAEMFVSLFLLICKRRALQIRLCVIVFSYSAVCLSTPLAPHHLTDVLLSTTRDQCVALNIT